MRAMSAATLLPQQSQGPDWMAAPMCVEHCCPAHWAALAVSWAGPQRVMGVLQLGLACVYCITAGKSMHAVWGYLCTEPCRPFGLSAWIVVFAALQIVLSQVDYFHSSAGGTDYSTLADCGPSQLLKGCA